MMINGSDRLAEQLSLLLLPLLPIHVDLSGVSCGIPAVYQLGADSGLRKLRLILPTLNLQYLKTMLADVLQQLCSQASLLHYTYMLK